jgi:hypothetical protein
MSSRGWKAAFAVALTAYLIVGTALLGELMNASGARALILVVSAEALLFLAALTCPSLWALVLPFVTIMPVWAWGRAACEPGFLDFCDLVWVYALSVAAFVGLPVAIVGTALGHLVRARA